MKLRPSQKPVSRQNDRWQRVLTETWALEVQPPRWPRYRFAIPAGTWYNPSAPGVSAALVSMSRMEVASAVHDPFYRLQGRVGYLMERLYHEGTPAAEWKPVRRIDRRTADQLFVHVMRLQDVEEWKAKVAYAGVRSPFGWWAWREEDEIDPQLLKAKREPTWCRRHFAA